MSNQLEIKSNKQLDELQEDLERSKTELKGKVETFDAEEIMRRDIDPNWRMTPEYKVKYNWQKARFTVSGNNKEYYPFECDGCKVKGSYTWVIEGLKLRYYCKKCYLER
jgi:hypothetical protein